MSAFEFQRLAQHRQVWELLPWLVNGTTTPAQTAQCEQHLDECAQCRDEYRSQLALREQIQSGEAVVYTPHAALRKLMTRIEQDERDTSATVASTPSRRTRWLAAAVVVQAIGLVGLAGFTYAHLDQIRAAPRYATLSSAPPATSTMPAARVVFFADQMSVRELNELLQSYDAQVVSGPNRFGVYTLAFPGRAAGAIAEAVERLGADPRVRFAELTDARARK